MWYAQELITTKAKEAAGAKQLAEVQQELVRLQGSLQVGSTDMHDRSAGVIFLQGPLAELSWQASTQSSCAQASLMLQQWLGTVFHTI